MKMYLIIELHSLQVTSLKNYLKLIGPLGGLHPFKKQYHFGSLIIEPNCKQLYMIENLHYNNHFQLDDIELRSYKSDLKKIGFVEADVSTASRPRKYYIVLKSSNDYHLPEITVLNLEKNIPLCTEIEYDQLCQQLLTLPHKARFDRNTFRFDIGYSSQNQRNSNCIKGMNVAAFGVSLDDTKGINNDHSMTISLLKHGSLLNRMLDEVCREKGLDLYFNDTERNSYFSNVIARRATSSYESCNFRAEGMSIALTGRVHGKTYKLENHVDSNNDFRQGYNVNICYSEIVSIPSNGRGASKDARVMSNLYGKKCCGDALERYRRYTKLLHCIKDYKKYYPQSWTISANILSFEDDEYSFPPPNVNKDVYYSIFVHEILYWSKHVRYNYYTVLELIYTMVLTPSPSAWRENVKLAMKSDSKENFFVRYVEEALKWKPSVSEGSNVRKQVSCGAGITYHQLFSSLRNMDELIKKTNSSESQKIETILQWWSQPIDKGGIHLVGPLWAQEILNVLAKVDIIKDKRFYNEGIVASSTNTSKKLKTYGIRTKKDRHNLLQFIIEHINYEEKPMTRLIAESSICEGLRFLDMKEQNNGNPYFAWPYVDTVHRTQHLYYTSNFELYVLRKNGTRNLLRVRAWEHNESFDGVMWWVDGQINTKHKSQKLSFSIKSTTKRRKFDQLLTPTLYSPLQSRR